jgi:hypothetical protein
MNIEKIKTLTIHGILVLILAGLSSTNLPAAERRTSGPRPPAVGEGLTEIVIPTCPKIVCTLETGEEPVVVPHGEEQRASKAEGSFFFGEDLLALEYLLSMQETSGSNNQSQERSKNKSQLRNQRNCISTTLEEDVSKCT